MYCSSDGYIWAALLNGSGRRAEGAGRRAEGSGQRAEG